MHRRSWRINQTFPFSEDVKPAYITSPVVKADIEQNVLADGSIKALKQVNVGAQVSGQIKALHVELGDKVTKGQALAEIDDLPQKNDLQNAQAGLKSAQAQRQAKQATLRNNQLAFERQRKILARGVGIQADYDSAKAQLDATKAEIESLDAQIVQANIAVDTAQLNLGYTKITSPIDGVVVAIPVEEGQTVNAVQSAPTILKVAQLDTMTIEAQISEADVPKVSVGMPVYFTILGGKASTTPLSFALSSLRLILSTTTPLQPPTLQHRPLRLSTTTACSTLKTPTASCVSR